MRSLWSEMKRMATAGVVLLAAAQGVEFRAPLATSAPLRQVLRQLRDHIAPLEADRFLAPDLETAARLVGSGKISSACGIPAADGLPELTVVGEDCCSRPGSC